MEDCEDKTQVNECIGVSRGGRSTKIHAVVDALGNPIEVLLTTGNTNDITVAEKLLSRIRLECVSKRMDVQFRANRGAIQGGSPQAYRGKSRETNAEVQPEAPKMRVQDFCIPPKKNEPDPWYVDWWLYKERHLVEKFFLKLKEFRRVATRYDKLASRFLSFVLLACIRILLA